MQKIKEFIYILWSILPSILFLYGEIAGIIHSVKKHSVNDTIAAVSIPPWAWWRSIEMWWHEDENKVNLEKQLSNDMKICIQFLIESTDSSNNETLLDVFSKEISKRIEKYPSDKREFLSTGTRIYIEYFSSINKDFIKSLDSYLKNAKFECIISSNTKQIGNSLKYFTLENATVEANKSFDDFCNHIFELIKDDDDNSHKYFHVLELKEGMNFLMDFEEKKYKESFQRIFNEDF